MAPPTLFDETAPSASIRTNPAGETADADWLQQCELRRSAPPALLKAAARGDVTKFATQLRKALTAQLPQAAKSRRKLLQTLHTLWTSSERNTEQVDRALAHCLFDQELSREERSGRVETLLASWAPQSANPEVIAAACWLLLLRADDLEPGTVFDLWRWSCDAASALPALAGEPAASQSVSLQLGELAWLLNLANGFHAGATKRTHELRTRISAQLCEVCSKDGALRAELLPDLLATLCSCARLTLSEMFAMGPVWSAKAKRRVERLVSRSVSLMSAERFAFSNESGASVTRQLREVIGISAADSEQQLREKLQQIARLRHKPGKARKERAWSSPAHQSDDAGWALLRPRWSGPASFCAVRTVGPQMFIDLVANGQTVIAGEWKAVVHHQGATALSEGDWSCVCWFTDKDAQYAEFQLALSGGLKLIRQLLLPTAGQFLLIAESVRAATPGASLELLRRLPLAEGWDVEQDSIAREIALQGAVHRIRLLSVSAPQFRLERSQESMSVREAQLQLHAQSAAQHLYNALVLDWSPERSDAPVDWNSLSVVEDGRQSRPEEALAWRWRVGDDQWLLYHSFMPPQIPRTAMGVHSASETIVTRIKGNGDFETLLEVEGEVAGS